MDIEVTSEVDPAEWRRLTADDRRSTFFHSLEWGRLLARTVRGFGMRYVVARLDGRLVAGMPLMLHSRGPFAVLESMPFGTYGGPLACSVAPGDAHRELLGHAARLFRSPRVAALHVHGLPTSTVCPGPFRALVEPAQVLRLSRPFDQILAGFKPSARNKIRKAEKAGVTVRIASSESDFVAYHGMLTECSRRWGTPVDLSRGFFVELASLGQETVQMWIAEHESQIVAGDLNFVYRDTIMNWGNVSRPQARPLAPNNLLHTAAIRWAVEHGITVYNLGSSRGLPGVGSFKASFGADTVDLVRLSLEKAWYRVVKTRGRRERGDAQP